MKTNVIVVTLAPDLKNLEFVSGVRDKNAAQAWGQAHGYAEVFFLKRRERVYAEKMAAAAVMAGELEQASMELVAMAEASRA